MSFSISGFSRRGRDLYTAAWTAAGGAANNDTLAAIDDAIGYARNNGLIYDAATATGLVRLNLFAGTAIADALRCQISELGVSAVDTTGTFVAGDFINKGTAGGITAGLASSKHIVTTLAPSHINSSMGAVGAYLCSDFNIPVGTWYSPVASVNAGQTVVNGPRMGNTGQLQGFWGNGSAGIVVPSGSDTGPSLLSAVGTGTNIHVYEDATQTSAGTSSADSGLTNPFFVFAASINGAPSWYMDANAATRMGGYYAWKGLITTTQVGLVATMFADFSRTMGRIP